jgi:hypothetical protein
MILGDRAQPLAPQKSIRCHLAGGQKQLKLYSIRVVVQRYLAIEQVK